MNRALPTLLLLATLPAGAGGPALEVGEMIRNGDFAAGMAGWWSWTRPGDSARAEVVGGRLHARVERATDWWAANVYQTFGTLRPGWRYRLGFTARKRGPSSVMRIGFSAGAEPAVPIRVEGAVVRAHAVTLTDVEQAYAFEFELAGDEPLEHGNVAFWVGALPEVWLNDVSLLGPTRAPTSWAGLTTALTATGEHVVVELGKREPLLHDGQFGMRHFPDGALAVVGGLGPLAGRIWRIGLMGHSSTRENVLLLLGALQGILTAEGAARMGGPAAAEAVYAGD